MALEGVAPLQATTTDSTVQQKNTLTELSTSDKEPQEAFSLVVDEGDVVMPRNWSPARKWV